jgi:hypothetical protein
MSNTNTGGPAFPVSHDMALIAGLQNAYGMTLRDYFAAKYLEGYMANPEIGFPEREDAAREAYAMADAMLKARGQ